MFMDRDRCLTKTVYYNLNTRKKIRVYLSLQILLHHHNQNQVNCSLLFAYRQKRLKMNQLLLIVCNPHVKWLPNYGCIYIVGFYQTTHTHQPSQQTWPSGKTQENLFTLGEYVLTIY